MLLVVFGHVNSSMGVGGYDSVLGSLLLTFRMPLFFFVSGFFSFRSLSWWNKSRVFDILQRKTQAQILGTVFFVSLFCFAHGEWHSWLTKGFGGYWFTIVLFQMYLAYLVLSLISRLLKKNIAIPVMIVISLVGIGIIGFAKGNSWLWTFLCFENLFKYFQFFTLGIIGATYRNKFFDLLKNRYFITIVTCGWIVCEILWYSDAFKAGFPLLYNVVHDILIRYFSLMTVVSFFYGHEQSFSLEKRSGRVLQFIGRRTLDLYMLHYFFIPSLGFMKTWLENGNMIIVQLVVASAIMIVIVGVCMIISSILRHSRYLEAWLFGVKRRA